DVGVVAGVEEGAQNLLALARVGFEEPLKAALRKQHDLAELLPAKAEEVLGSGAHPRPAGGQGRAGLDEGAVRGSAQSPEGGLLEVHRGSLAAEARALLLGRSRGAVEVGAEGEVEGDAGEHLGLSVV